MRKFSFILFVAVLVSNCLSGVITSEPVGPGVIHYHDYIHSGPWHINVLQIDLTNEWITLETVKADDRLAGNEPTSSMCNRIDEEAYRVVGAVNGDFYATGGIPIGAQIINGELLKRPYPRSAFGYHADTSVVIDIFSFQGSVFTTENTALPINGINENRGTNQLIIYNRYYADRTGTNEWGTEITGIYIDEDFMVNDTVRIVVTAKDSINTTGHGNSVIPVDGIILSGHGMASDSLNHHVFIGDTISFLLHLPPSTKRLKAMIGGMPRMIRNGQISVEWSQENISETFCTDRHPRTAVGFSQDSTIVYFFTVDGRQAGYSVGMSLYELANYMLGWGVYQGINLDGGGSTTMVVRGEVMNRPSDGGGERSVANALMVISEAPTGETAHLKITPQEAFVLANNQIQFHVEPFDAFYNPNPINPDSIQIWSCDTTLGSFDETGLFTAGNDTLTGYIYVESAGIRDSARIHITVLSSLNLEPDPVILEVSESQQMTVQAYDNYNNRITIAAENFIWSVSGGIGQISASGLFTATAEGAGLITVTHGEIADSVEVTVGASTSIIIDQFHNTDNYSLTGTLVDLAACHLSISEDIYYSSPSSAQLQYSLQTGGTSALYLNCSIPVSGSPESVGLYVYGDGNGHWLRGEFDDVDGEKFLVNFTQANPGINWNNEWQFLEFPFSEAIAHWSNGSAVLTFPIVWKKIYLAETDDGNKDSGVIYFDDFTMNYVEPGFAGNDESGVPQQYNLLPNFPNPFNPTTTIEYSLPKSSDVELAVYDALGQKVEVLVDRQQTAGRYRVTWRAERYSSGVYFYRLSCPDFKTTRKMLLIR